MSDIALIFLVVSLLTSVTDIVFGVKAMMKKTKIGRYLGMSSVFAALVTLFYLCSVFSPEYRLSSVFSSLYFISVDFMVVCMVYYIAELTGLKTTKTIRTIQIFVHTYLLFDVIVLLVNPVWEIVIHYVPRLNVTIAFYTYEIYMLYELHLAFSYLLIASVIGLLIRKVRQVPNEYKMRYILHIVGILLVVLVNAGFLFVKSNAALDNLDLSIWMYAFVIVFFYLSNFILANKSVMNNLRVRVFDSISQGIAVFDYNDKLVLWNKRAEKLIPDVDLEEGMKLQQLIETCRLPLDVERTKGEVSFQFYTSEDDNLHPLRCDYRPQYNEHGQNSGHLLVLTDAAFESDLLTGFHGWDSFKQLVEEYPESYRYPAVVVIADISGMTEINSSLGRQAGDKLFVEMADLFRSFFPRDTYFVRGTDGRMIAIKRGKNEDAARKCIQEVRNAFSGYFIYAIASTSAGKDGMLGLIENAEKALRTRKLMDRHSKGSEVLNSLIRALEECDPDTEAHVLRTRTMGAELGKRLGLSDMDQSNLSLLCILHDIGKIGIPLEILNKPGRLTDAEWRVLQSHVYKGAQIAKSTEGFQAVADMILHHHERWDGHGYPDGLSKESIPFLSRIISVVDSYDAMVNDRSYQKRISRESAIEELRKGAGHQYDPSIVAEFVQMLYDGDADDFDVPVDQLEVISENEKRENEASLEDNRVHLVAHSRYMLDEEMRIIWADENFESLTGYSREDVASGKLTQLKLLPQEDQLEYQTMLMHMLSETDLIYCEHRLARKDGTILNIFCTGRVYYSSADRQQRSEILITDISESYAMRVYKERENINLDKRQAQWEKKFRRDSLTGMLTHEALMNDTEERILAGDNYAVMIMMDLDHFKQYNDAYGHQAGDDYLKYTADAIRTSIRENDLASRMGGDEYAVVMFFNDNTDTRIMQNRAQMIYEKISQQIAKAPHGGSISMGAACFSGKIGSFREMYAAADRALYESKEGGRGRISFCREQNKA